MVDFANLGAGVLKFLKHLGPGGGSIFNELFNGTTLNYSTRFIMNVFYSFHFKFDTSGFRGR